MLDQQLWKGEEGSRIWERWKLRCNSVSTVTSASPRERWDDLTESCAELSQQELNHRSNSSRLQEECLLGSQRHRCVTDCHLWQFPGSRIRHRNALLSAGESQLGPQIVYTSPLASVPGGATVSIFLDLKGELWRTRIAQLLR